MVRHNNMIPNNHFHKKWQRLIKIHFDQPMRKKCRLLTRVKKLRKMAPRPMKLLRPMVHCPSIRYNSKIRVGKGFSLLELKKAGVNRKLARTIGIAVDQRRRNHSMESVFRNAERLKEYRNNLILYPKNQKVAKTDDGKKLNAKPTSIKNVKGRRVTEDEKKFEAFVTLRKAQSDAKHFGLRLKRKLGKNDTIDPVLGK